MANEKIKPPYHVVSFSGGKDSTALLLRMIELNLPIDEIIFCDTTVEYPAMYEHIAKVEKYIGREITRFHAQHDFEFYLLKQKHSRTKNEDIAAREGRSFPTATQRWCTGYHKVHILDKYYTQLRKNYRIVDYVGIAADEQKRVKDKNYPLIEWGWTEADCLKYCYEKGFDWGDFTEFLTEFPAGVALSKN